MATHAFTIKEAVNFGFNAFKKNWQFLLISFLIVLVVGMIPSILHDWAKENLPQTAFIFSIVGWIVQMITSIGVIVICLKIVDGKTPKLADVYEHYPLVVKYLLGTIIYSLVVVAGFILLIVPGIIWGIKYQYTTYLIVDKKMEPWAAFKKSGHITQGHKLKLFYLGLVYAGLMILGIIAFGIGLLIVWPIVSISGAYVYRKLSSKE